MGVNLEEEVKIKSAEIKYTFTNEKKASADFKIKYEDGSTKTGSGVQAVEEADSFVKELKENPIFNEENGTSDN